MAENAVAGGTGAGGSRGFNGGMPVTTAGKWAMWLGVAFVIGFMINGALVGIFGTTKNAAMSDFSRTYLPYWGVALMGTGFISGIVGLVAILGRKERSAFTLITLIPTAFVTLFLLGELLLPH